jgi:hypothetical protein
MSDVLIPDQMKRTRLDFGSDNTPLNKLFGTQPLTIAQMQSRLWTHIENRKIVVNGHGAQKSGKAASAKAT